MPLSTTLLLIKLGKDFVPCPVLIDSITMHENYCRTATHKTHFYWCKLFKNYYILPILYKINYMGTAVIRVVLFTSVKQPKLKIIMSTVFTHVF